MHRRDFVRHMLAGGTAWAAGGVTAGESSAEGKPLEARICLFTDHLDDHGYTYEEVARMLRELKIAGPDLTVRSGGLVLPERVAEDLPRAVHVFREHGLDVPMISTGVARLGDPAAEPTLRTMAKLGIGYYKLGYFRYERLDRWQEQINQCRIDLAGLVRLGKELGVRAGFHNHSGPHVGGALWDSWEILHGLESDWIGFYFDPSHATIEGGLHAWKLNFHRVAARLKMVALKDFVWENSGGERRTRWVPLGEGLVQWDEFFALLVKTPFPGPISLHIEYDPGGTTKMERLEKSFAAAEKDLAFLRRGLRKAQGKS